MADAQWQVFVDDKDISSALRPFLMSLDVNDRDGTESDTCSLRFDDTAGQIKLPKVGASLRVLINGVQIFKGPIESTPWSMSRSEGRVLGIEAKGIDTRGKVKVGQRWHMDDATLKDVLTRSARVAGISAVAVDPELGAIRREYWSPDGQSFLSYGAQLARQFGATFKIQDGRAVFAKRGTGTSVAGAAMPTIEAVIGRNVLTVNIDPLKGRRRFAKTRVRFFDRASATYKEREIEIDTEFQDPGVVEEVRGTAANEADADRAAQSRKTAAERDSGSGTIELNIEPAAQAEGTVILRGARAGIDGTYRIVGVRHRVSRSEGSRTTLEIAQPGGETGKDERAPSSEAA